MFGTNNKKKNCVFHINRTSSNVC